MEFLIVWQISRTSGNTSIGTSTARFYTSWLKLDIDDHSARFRDHGHRLLGSFLHGGAADNMQHL